jgi:hypothetical protein
MDSQIKNEESNVHASYEPFSFVKGLEGSKLEAITTALNFLIKTAGNKPTLGTLVGVDVVKLECVREFSKPTRSMKEWELIFEEGWNTPGKCRNLMETLDPANKLHRKKENKDGYKALWMAQARQRTIIESSSAEYRLSFIGSVGNWSTTFVVGCTGFTNSPHLTVLDEIISDKDFDA